MKVYFERSFQRDLKKISDKKVKQNIKKLFADISEANSIMDFSSIIKLKSYKTYYRIRLGDYRIGLDVIDNDVYIVRILLRKDIYKFFP